MGDCNDSLEQKMFSMTIIIFKKLFMETIDTFTQKILFVA